MADRPDIRIGTAEREEAVALLGEHFAAGRLSLAEFDERVALATQATVRGDLIPLVADLPSAPAAMASTGPRDLAEQLLTLVPFVLVALLMFAGADQEAVFADYLRTNDELLPHFDDFFARFASLGGDPDLITPLLGVRREYLEVAIDEALSRYGTIEQYFAAGLGLDDDTLQALRTRLVDPNVTA